jgi:Flp pilus assembly protein TadD
LLLKIDGDRSTDGLSALQKAVTLNANLYEGQITLGRTLLRLNRASEAVEHLQKAADLAPNNPEPHFQLALAYRKLGDRDKAATETEIVKKIHEGRRGVSNQTPQ